MNVFATIILFALLSFMVGCSCTPVPTRLSLASTTGAGGIITYTINSANYSLTQVSILNAKLAQPFWLEHHPKLSVLYTADLNTNGGTVRAYEIYANKSLTEISSIDSNASAPWHMAIHPSSKYMVVSGYVQGRITTLGLDSAGKLTKVISAYQLISSGPGPRQGSAHPHQAVFNKNFDKVFVPDLGGDKVWVFDVSSAGVLSLLTSFSSDAGVGPRHLAFSSDEKYMYVLNEIASSVTTWTRQANSTNALPSYVATSTISLIDVASNTNDTAVTIQVSKDDKAVYAAVRRKSTKSILGHFSVDAGTGKLTLVENHLTASEPRSFVKDYKSNILYLACGSGQAIEIYQILANNSLVKKNSVYVADQPQTVEFF